MALSKNADDAVQLENLSNLIAASVISPNSENLHLMARGLSRALNLCIKRLDKEPAVPPSPACPKCNSADIRVHGKVRASYYCPKCFKTFSSSTTLHICPDCVPESQLAEAATAKIRYRCKNCKTTYMEGVGIPTDFNKFIYFSHLIYNTGLSYNEIICKLKISSDTYYRWKKRLAIYFPNTRGYLYGKRHKK